MDNSDQYTMQQRTNTVEEAYFQARRQDLAAGGAKNQEGPKTRRGAHF